MDITNFGIHIALSKYPLGDTPNYINKLQKLYNTYKSNIRDYLMLKEGADGDAIDEYLQILYKPRVIHIFSHFDVGFISIVDNYKFNQRIFEPQLDEDEVIRSVSYQILSGQIVKWNNIKGGQWLLQNSDSFLKIIQLKINNGILVGNGITVQSHVIDKIVNILDKGGVENYLIVRSFNWSELILICEHADPNKLANAIIKIRSLSLNSIPKNSEDILKHSLYGIDDWSVTDAQNSHFFSDSLSYLGVDYNKILDIDKNTKLETMVEWQVKPGHLPSFIDNARELPLNVNEYKNVYFKNGKTDYFIKENRKKTFESNQLIFNELRNNTELRKHIRKIKTKALYSIDEETVKHIKIIQDAKLSSPCSTEKCLERYRISNSKKVSGFLRMLNISRITRKKISKIIYNYNLGIQDPILCTYFIDLHNPISLFIKELSHLANEIENALKNGTLKEDISKDMSKTLKSNYIENELLQRYISVLDEAFEDRILNNYNYEDINEFSLEINSSLTGIVSAIDTLVKLIGSSFRDNSGNAIVTTINDKATISNRISVNYNVEHLTNVPLIFATLIKEILNIEESKTSLENWEMFKDFEEEVSSIFFSDSFESDSEEDEKKDDALGDFLGDYDWAYFTIDLKKLSLSFLGDIDLFIFWHWVYPFQSTHLYSSIGHFDELNFVRELYRLLLVIQAVNPAKIEELSCPIPEMRSFWDKYFNRIHAIVEKIAGLDIFKKLKSSIREQLYNSIYKLNDPYDNISRHKKTKKYAQNYLKLIKHQAQYYADSFNTEKFVKEMFEEFDLIAIKHEASSVKDKRQDLFKIITYISFYNLNFIAKKFDSKVSLLRRDYTTGAPIEHFLQSDLTWYVDPFGGFFINDIDERQTYLKLNNQMLELLWHISMYNKRDLFIYNENF